MLRKGENKNYRYLSFHPDGEEKIPKKQQKNSKNWKIPLRLQSKQKYVRKCWESEKIKTIVLFRSIPKGKRKFQKNSKNIQKIKKYHYVFIAWQNRLERVKKERKQKLSFHYVPTQPVRENSNKITEKFKKYNYGIISSQNRLDKAEKGRK